MFSERLKFLKLKPLVHKPIPPTTAHTPRRATHRTICQGIPHVQVLFTFVLSPTLQCLDLAVQGWVCPGLPGFKGPRVRQSLSDTKAEVLALDFHPVCFLKKQRTALDQGSQDEMVRGTSANIQRSGRCVPVGEALKGGLATVRCPHNASAQDDSEGLTFSQLSVSVIHFVFCVLWCL